MRIYTCYDKNALLGRFFFFSNKKSFYPLVFLQKVW